MGTLRTVVSASRIVNGPLVRRLAVALMLAVAVVPVREGAALARAAQPADGQGYGTERPYESRRALKVESAGPRPSGPLSAVQERALKEGPLSPDPAALRRLKDEAAETADRTTGGPAGPASLEGAVRDARAASGAGAPRPAPQASLEGAVRAAAAPPGPRVPITISSLGLSDPNVAPSDATVAAGTSRYIQLVNRKFGIYGFNGSSIASGTLNQLIGSPSGSAFDPQIIWDPDTDRFYYVTVLVFSANDNRLAFGFSKTSAPASAADFCQYFLNYGNILPDYPKLGDSQNRALIGVNSFNAANAYVGSDLIGISKPPTGATCPAAATFLVDVFINLGSGGGRAFTPVPANQTDGSTTGYVVSVPESVFSGPANKLIMFKATESGSTMNVTVADLPVSSYSIPANAVQPGTANRLDSSDTRNTQAVSAINPSRGNVVGLWTQHTIFGGGGAAVRAYEINPAVPSILEAGDIAAPGVYFFNAAISPDRVAVGATRRFGDSMAMGFNASATNLRASILTASRIGSNPISFQFVAQSPAVLNDFTCGSGVCRWGDYAGAAPVPIDAPSLAHGIVVHSTNFVQTTGSPSSSGWGTLNMYIIPN